MPKKSVKHHVKEEVIEEKKPEILKTEEVVEQSTEVDKVNQVNQVEQVNPVNQLAAVVEPVAEVNKVNQVEQVNQEPVVPVIPVEPVVPESKKKLNWLWPVWIALAFVLGAGAGFGLSKINFDKKAKSTPVVVNKTTVSPTVKPTEAVEKKYDRATIKVKVLNGSGVKGAAATRQTALEKLGYKGIVVGNVEGENYSNSEVSMKDSLKVFESEILKDLGVATADKKVLASDDAFDILFIIGEK